VLSLALLACSSCSLLIEESARFSADTSDSMDEVDSPTDDDSATDDLPVEVDLPAEDTEGIPDSEPPRPPWLIVDELGDPNDADVLPLGPALLLAGGGNFVDAAFQWQAQRIAGGDIVVLQAAGEPLLTGYLFGLGGANSVQTLIVPPGVASLDPWITWTVANAEAVLIAGDDPYGLIWKDTPIETAIMHAWARGAVIGGVDAGLSSLGEFVFPDHAGPLTSSQALANPYASGVVLDRDYLTLEPLADALIESRFADLDRMGRLLAFAARVIQDGWSSTGFVGIGVDANTAMVIDADGLGVVHGTGHVHVFRTNLLPDQCAPGQTLEFGPVFVAHLAAGDTATWPGGQTNIAGEQVFALMGVTEPLMPY
jgi:cyanophycinase-like exopeptidase